LAVVRVYRSLVEHDDAMAEIHDHVDVVLESPGR